MNTTRHFLRCPDCLSVWSADIPNQATPGTAWMVKAGQRHALEPFLEAGCALGCGCARAESMGALDASGTRLVELEVENPCDAACTHARGCKCDCPCGGANHGAGAMADYLVGVDNGPLAVRMREMPKSAGAALERAREWRKLTAQLEAARAAVEVEYRDLVAKKRAGWLDTSSYDRMMKLGRWSKRAFDLNFKRTHAGRMKAAAELLGLA